MTPARIDAAVARARCQLNTLSLLAHNHFKRTRLLLMTYSGETDIEKAKRDKAIGRAEAILERKLKAARVTYTRQLQQIRRRAGRLASLVPAVSK